MNKLAKEFLKDLWRIYLIGMGKIIGLTLVCVALFYLNPLLGILGVIITDLVPSFIKEVWKQTSKRENSKQ